MTKAFLSVPHSERHTWDARVVGIGKSNPYLAAYIEAERILAETEPHGPLYVPIEDCVYSDAYRQEDAHGGTWLDCVEFQAGFALAEALSSFVSSFKEGS
jgi:hypothetical protein